LFDDLKQTGDLAEVVIVRGFHKVREGRNGEGNPWYTDGDLYEGRIKQAGPDRAVAGRHELRRGWSSSAGACAAGAGGGEKKRAGRETPG